MKYTIIDLFGGMGGFSTGFEMAGYDVLLGIDNWSVAIETFQKNHKSAIGMLADLTTISDDFFVNYSKKVDVLVAGPPCQGFSIVGKRDVKDPRNSLFEEVIRATQIIKPKIVIIENVVGLLSMKNPDGKMVRDLIIDRLEKIGYNTECRILNSADYGVPQRRKRVIFIGSAIGSVGFPEPDKNVVTVGHALDNIPDAGTLTYLPQTNKYQKLMSEGTIEIFNHEMPKHNEKIIKRMSFVPQGGNWRNIPKKFYGVGGVHSNNYKRLDPNLPAITIKHATKSMIIHPRYNRCLTVRETARLQSFPDNFVICGTRFEQHQQLANAVPPLMARAIAEHIQLKLNGLEPKKLQKKIHEYLVSNEHIKINNTIKHSGAFTFIDLFSGIGGFRIAFEKNGGKCIFSCDIDKWANNTYFLNFGDWPKNDITKIKASEIPDHDILCAGFPCQPFSIAGRRLGFEDTRGTLFFEIEKILKTKKPKAFILENVKGLLNHDNGNTFNTIKNVLEKLGYNIFYKVMNARDYGLPQNRERVFIVGFRYKVDFNFPQKIELNNTVWDILEKNIKAHNITETSKRHIRKHYKNFISSGKKNGFPAIATEIRPSRCVIRSDGIAPCLTAKMGTGGNNIPVLIDEERKFTVRECLRLMGFPESFKIDENKMQSYKQIGNSVPVAVVEAIAEQMVKYLE